MARGDTKFLFECKYFTGKRWERRNLLRSHSNSDLFTCENNMIFSRVKISGFRAFGKGIMTIKKTITEKLPSPC